MSLLIREATALAVDRAPLLTIGLAGQGAVATGMFPPDQGVENVPMQSSDPARAKQVLDAAGWTVGSDGVRAKNGQLSFLGLGMQPPTPEWGEMINEAARYFQEYPWQMIAPGLCIGATVLAINLLGDGLRDVADPRTPRGLTNRTFRA